MTATVLPFPGNPDAPIVPISQARAHFGQRKASALSQFSSVLDSACGVERKEDREEIDQFKNIARAGREAAAALKGAAQSNDAKLAREISDVLDNLTALALARKSVRFQLLAQQLASLSEVCSLIEAEAT